jgi:hypothetical protein
MFACEYGGLATLPKRSGFQSILTPIVPRMVVEETAYTHPAPIPIPLAGSCRALPHKLPDDTVVPLWG